MIKSSWVHNKKINNVSNIMTEKETSKVFIDRFPQIKI
jgi:hypothetical protein